MAFVRLPMYNSLNVSFHTRGNMLDMTNGAPAVPIGLLTRPMGRPAAIGVTGRHPRDVRMLSVGLVCFEKLILLAMTAYDRFSEPQSAFDVICRLQWDKDAWHGTAFKLFILH
jgi:hypothetical protein